MVLLPKTFKRLDWLKHALVAMHPVCEMPWSLQWQSYLRESKPVPALICYMLAKKMEACMHRRQGSSDTYRDRYRKYPAPKGWMAMLAEEELLLPDPEPLDPGVSELDIIEGLSLRMTQAMNHYQHEECHCFVSGATDHFAQDCQHWEAFHIWHKEHLNSKGAGPQPKEPAPKSLSQK